MLLDSSVDSRALGLNGLNMSISCDLCLSFKSCMIPPPPSDIRFLRATIFTGARIRPWGWLSSTDPKMHISAIVVSFWAPFPRFGAA